MFEKRKDTNAKRSKLTEEEEEKAKKNLGFTPESFKAAVDKDKKKSLVYKVTVPSYKD
jgi:hypothetical protein